MERSPIQIRPDGSDRAFVVTGSGTGKAVAVHPSPGDAGKREALSYFRIGTHLHRAGIPVPEILAFDEASGVVHVSFIEGRHLEEEVLECRASGRWDAVEARYRAIIRHLARMQVLGARGFDPSWCFDTPRYDGAFAFEREARYFLSAFARGLMGLTGLDVLEDELRGFSALVDDLPGQDFFLHRDFQSRNILVNGDGIGIVDFQGGRLGPLGYDLASLLFDPYADLPSEIHGPLIASYLDDLSSLGVSMDPIRFSEGLQVLAVLRMLQALGAYAHLALVKGRARFREYIPAALANLDALCTGPLAHKIPALRRLLDRILPFYA
ncbi:MAG: phosphotransferase [Deltaproteobacteria bacterium]